MWKASLVVCLALFSAGVIEMIAAAVPPANADSTAPIVQGNNQFAFDLYGKLQKKEGNLFFSPYSISSALGMTYAGARGDTADQMAATLHFGKDQDKFHPAFAQLIKQINGDGKPRSYELVTANALWLQHDYHFLPDYLKLVNADYGAELREVDFKTATEQTRKAINAWVEKQTKDKIKELFKPGVLDSNSRLVLTNAIYFKGTWASPFLKSATHEEAFYLTADNQAKVPMMHHKAHFGYAETDKLQVLEMTYKGNDLSMVVLLPKKVDGLADLEKNLTADNLKTWTGKMQRPEVIVALPKFQMTSEFQLKEVLSDLGMKDAFTDKANFGGMSSSRDLYIQAVVHKAFVDVNEEGTEAAAATGVAIGVMSAPVDQPKIFKADHPFVFVIRDVRNGSVLFVGRVMNPKG